MNVKGADVDGCGAKEEGSGGVPARLRRRLGGGGPVVRVRASVF